MKIILNQDVKNLGEEGDVCVVADGYARNYLLPKALALPYNALNLNNLKAREKAIASRKEKKRQEALGLKERLEREVEIEIVMPSADGGRLFGSVTSATISERLAHQGLMVERKQIEIPGRTIKVVGTYKASVRLYDSQIASLTVVVKSSKEEQKVPEAVPSGAAEDPVEVVEGQLEEPAEAAAEPDNS